ncbi:MAG: histidinol dehydrogenase [Candidatus Peribacteraceae bacterium]|nr:histidinol dehydrogenase [Candidatus Peribacteraceae bacterium]
MQVFSFSSADKDKILRALERPSENLSLYREKVQPIIKAVQSDGDAGLRELTRRFDGADITEIRVPSAACVNALTRMPAEWMSAVTLARENIERFHIANMLPASAPVETRPGVACKTVVRAIERVGIYVPGGTAPLFSTVLMLGIPAKLAGVSRIVLCSPPQKNGEIADPILAAAALLKIDVVCRVGGAQAIAAMAYGTECVPKVQKIVGPGNAYVTAAKAEVSIDPAGAAIDMLAGPSELMVIADGSADAKVIAADLLAQAEHGPDSQVVFVTTDESLLRSVLDCMSDQLRTFPRSAIAGKALEKSVGILVENLDQALDIVNLYAPEHLSIQTVDPGLLVENVRNAGSIFLGGNSPEACGDYCSGPNHSLPTSGAARYTGGVSVETFRKRITVQELSLEGLTTIGPAAAVMARAEDLEGHARSVDIRLRSLSRL